MEGAVAAGGVDELAVAAEGDGLDAVFVAFEGAAGFASSNAASPAGGAVNVIRSESNRVRMSVGRP